MTEKARTTRKSAPKKEVQQPKKSQQLIGFKEFFLGTDYRSVRKAAFKMWLDGKMYHSNEEWQRLLKKFESR